MSDSSGSSIPTAAIAACASVGGLLGIFLMVRIGLCIHRRRRHKPVPLPPARPLTAIHTSSPWNTNPTIIGSTAKFSSSKVDLSSPTSASPSPIGYYYPEPSMVQRGAPRSVYRQCSSGSTLNTDEVPLHQPSSPVTRASTPLADDGQLVPPQPLFFASQGTNSNRSSAQLSLISSTEESDIASYPPQRHQSTTSFAVDPALDDPAAISSNGTSCPPNSPPRITGRTSHRLSVDASVPTTQTTRSMRSTRTHSTVRGAPHKPHNRVEIILPTPLAPPAQRESLYVHDMNVGPGYGMSSRQSVCDPWLKVGRENTAPMNNYPSPPIRERERRHRTVSSESQSAARGRRTSTSSNSSFTANPNSPALPRDSYTSSAASRSPSISSQSRVLRNRFSLDLSNLPPVPRVPSMYMNSPASTAPSSPVLALSDSITGSGRLRGLASDSTILKRALPSNVDLKQHTPPNAVEEKETPSVTATE